MDDTSQSAPATSQAEPPLALPEGYRHSVSTFNFKNLLNLAFDGCLSLFFCGLLFRFYNEIDWRFMVALTVGAVIFSWGVWAQLRMMRTYHLVLTDDAIIEISRPDSSRSLCRTDIVYWRVEARMRFGSVLVLESRQGMKMHLDNINFYDGELQKWLQSLNLHGHRRI